MGLYKIIGLTAVGLVYTGICLYKNVGVSHLIETHYIDENKNIVPDSVVFEERKKED